MGCGASTGKPTPFASGVAIAPEPSPSQSIDEEGARLSSSISRHASQQSGQASRPTQASTGTGSNSGTGDTGIHSSQNSQDEGDTPYGDDEPGMPRFERQISCTSESESATYPHKGKMSVGSPTKVDRITCGETQLCYEMRDGPPPTKLAFVPCVVHKPDKVGNDTINEYTVVAVLGKKTNLVVSNATGMLYIMSRRPRPRSAMSFEVAALSRILNPHVVHLFEYIDDSTGPSVYLVQEYLPGGCLSRITQAGLPVGGTRVLNDRDALDCLRQVARGLAELHSRKVAHRNINPATILWSQEESGKRRYALGSMESCRLFEGSDLVQNAPKSSHPAYRAPETSEGRRFSARTADMWSLGATTLALMTGRLPFDWESQTSRSSQSGSSCGLQLNAGDDELPPLTQKLLFRMLRADPHRRCTLSELAKHPCFADLNLSGSDDDEEENAENASCLTGSRVLSAAASEGQAEERGKTDASSTSSRPSEAARLLQASDEVLIVHDPFAQTQSTEEIVSDVVHPGVIVHTARSEAEGVFLRVNRRIIAILLDFYLQEATGCEVAIAMQKAEVERGLPHAPIICFVAADADDNITALCLESGITRVLHYPLQSSSLERVLKPLGIPLRSSKRQDSGSVSSAGGLLSVPNSTSLALDPMTPNLTPVTPDADCFGMPRTQINIPVPLPPSESSLDARAGITPPGAVN
eukprot:Hpha_TRINITY_DN11420_c0_g2::TRINITY_DN11420_c0_g2_i1::g.137564::m.137564